MTSSRDDIVTQTFLEVRYCNHSELLPLHIFAFEKRQQEVQHGDVVRSEQPDRVLWGEEYENDI